MKKDNAKTRIDKMLNADKAEINEPTKEAAIADFARIAREYFETDGNVIFEIKRTKNAFDVSLSFRAVRVKNFNKILS